MSSLSCKSCQQGFVALSVSLIMTRSRILMTQTTHRQTKGEHYIHLKDIHDNHALKPNSTRPKNINNTPATSKMHTQRHNAMIRECLQKCGMLMDIFENQNKCCDTHFDKNMVKLAGGLISSQLCCYILFIQNLDMIQRN